MQNILFELPKRTLVNLRWYHQQARTRTLMIGSVSESCSDNFIEMYRFEATDYFKYMLPYFNGYDLSSVSEKEAEIWIKQYQDFISRKHKDMPNIRIDIDKLMRYTGPTYKFRYIK